MIAPARHCRHRTVAPPDGLTCTGCHLEQREAELARDTELYADAARRVNLERRAAVLGVDPAVYQ